MPQNSRSGGERLMDLAVYAPLGLALEFRRMFPELAERGRRQVTFTKALGKTAVTRGGTQLRRRLQSEVDGAGETPPPTEDPAVVPAGQTPVVTESSVAELAIEDYDSLSAQHVVRRLEGLSPDELAAVGAYEEQNRGRRTILTRVSQLRD